MRSWTFAVDEIAHAVNAAEPLDTVLGLFYGPANLDQAVDMRFTFVGLPLELLGAHSGPTRAVALVG